ncbi:hypothetical protein FLLO111716_14370 [Flavobacterium longum]|uniref:hypothetical protein n=1 Tax=Flavobacterium longum TaxID=1299340 RepID=UPI0039E863A5
MKKKTILYLLLAPLFSFGQVAPGGTTGQVKIRYANQPIRLHDPARENPVLVVFGNQSFFVKDKRTVTDTLEKHYRYQVLTNSDSIRRYTNSAFVNEVLLVIRK